MKETIIFFGFLSALSTLLVLIVFIYGLIVLIRGKFKKIIGKQARIAGLFLVGQLPLCLLIYGSLYESLKWGRQANAIQGNIGHTIIFLICGIGGLMVALVYIKNQKKMD
jgi:hypothetical protein